MRQTRIASSRTRVLTMTTLMILAVAIPATAPMAHENHEDPNASAEASGPSLNLEQRQEVFVGLAVAQQRAGREAAKVSAANPESMAEEALAKKLTTKYRRAVLTKYGLTPKQGEEIIVEGYEKSWKVGESKSGTVKRELD